MKVEIVCMCATAPVMRGLAECPVHRKPRPAFIRNPDRRKQDDYVEFVDEMATRKEVNNLLAARTQGK